jgi:hypothetical protein
MQNFITGCFTISGVVIGGLIGYITAIKVTERKAFQKAALEFHDAFLDSLMSLDERYHYRDETEKNVYEILIRDFDKQIKAMLKFRLYLPVDQREAFDKAWYEYCRYDVDGEPKYPFLEQYFEKSWNGQSTKDLALSRIENLLGFIECAHKLNFFPGGKL